MLSSFFLFYCSGAYQTFVYIYKKHGFRGMFRGNLLILAKVPMVALSFASYETFKEYFNVDVQEDSFS